MMSFDSFLRLGWAFARVVVRNLWGTGAQLPRFIAQYQRDGIVPFEPNDRVTLQGASRCIACGSCDIAALQQRAHRALGPHGPMAFVLGVSRHSGEHDAAEITDAATPALLMELTRVCPVAVPFVALTDLVRRRKIDLVRARALPGEQVRGALGDGTS